MYNFGGVQMKKVAVIMGSDSDLPVVRAAIEQLKAFDIPVEARVISAHRTPQEAGAFAESARAQGFGVLIAAAGKAAHLAGVLAAYTTLPVIGLPIKSDTLDGLDSLLSIVQMPSGVPVAAVAIDGAKNAGLLAAQILAVTDGVLAGKLDDFKREMYEGVLKKDEKLQKEVQKV
jgi:5-(carboxyamino)imidazole ribonucleotide mutase